MIGAPVIQTKTKQERKIEELQSKLQAQQEKIARQIDQQREELAEEQKYAAMLATYENQKQVRKQARVEG